MDLLLKDRLAVTVYILQLSTEKAKGYTFLPSNQRRCSARNISIDYSTISAGQGIIPEQKEDGKMKTPRQSAMETDRKLRKGLLSF